ncbi:MAG: hypothetical protein QOG15_1372 [Solirubrobacteraceae bacterium]|jgi:hypothetical protein|nr:hypothetical protein [Solirubrobacteraceae bacterium]
MALGDRYIANAKKAVAAIVDEEVLNVSFASRSGSMNAVLAGQVLRGAEVGLGGDGITGVAVPRGAIEREGAKKTRLPMNFIIAVTPKHIHVYKHKMLWGTVKLKGELGVFERERLEVTVETRGITKQFSLVSPAGQQMRFEMAKHRVTTELADLLQTPAG